MHSRPAVLAAVVLAAGCRGADVADTSPVAATHPDMSAGQRAFLAGRSAEAMGYFRRARSHLHTGTSAAEIDYWLGLCELEMNRPGRALVCFSRALSGEAGPEVKGLILLAEALAHYRLHRFEKAIEACRRAEESAAGAVPADEVLYRRAVALRRLGRWEEAASLFREVASRFPEGPRAEEARRSADRRRRYFTCQLGWFEKRENAVNLQAAARRAGFEARLEPGLRNGRPGVAVTVGRYPAFNAALAALKRLHRAGFQAFVTP